MSIIQEMTVSLIRIKKEQIPSVFDEGLNRLMDLAKEVRGNAQSPYFKFFVGAAVESESGKIYSGCNVERCTGTQSSHAEQNAIDSMIAAEGSAKIKRIFVVGAQAGQAVPIQKHDEAHDVFSCSCDREVVLPCGHCRTIIWENCCGDFSVPIFSLSKSGNVILTTISSLYPFPFGPEDLGMKYGKTGGQNGR